MGENEFKPDYKIPPSVFLIELVAWFLKENINNSNLSFEEWEGLMNNELKINEKIAEELEKVFKVSKQMWLNLQNNYDKK